MFVNNCVSYSLKQVYIKLEMLRFKINKAQENNN